MYYTSANRDETVFDDPNTFDIHRSPNPHLSFGIGEHFCLGAHLARLEGRVFFEEVLSTFSEIELTGEPVRVRSNLNAGYKRMPMRLTAVAPVHDGGRNLRVGERLEPTEVLGRVLEEAHQLGLVARPSHLPRSRATAWRARRDASTSAFPRAVSRSGRARPSSGS